MFALLFKCQQAGDKISERRGGNLGLRQAIHLKAWMGQLDKRGWGYPSKSFVVKQKGEYLAERRLTRLDSRAARLATQWGLHASRVVRSEGFFIYRLPYCHNFASVLCLARLPKHVASTGALLGKSGLLALFKACLNRCKAVLDGKWCREGAEDADGWSSVTGGQN